MCLNGRSVVGADFSVHSYYTTSVHCFTQAPIENQRAAVCHTRLDDDIRTHAINHFLNPNHVFGELNDWPSHPTEGVWVLLIPTDLKPLIRDQFERVLAIELELPDMTVALACQSLVLRIDDYSHVVSFPAAD